MAELVDVSDIVNLQTGGGAVGPQSPFFFKLGRIAGAAAPATIAGRPASLWRYDGQPAGAPIPTTVEAPDNTSVGALPFTSPGGGRQSWQLQAWATGLVAGTLVLYDRLLHIGGLSGTVTTAQTVGGTLTRNTGGVGNMMWAEIYTAIGATARTITASYTDQDGNTGATSVAAPIGATGFSEVTRVSLMPLASGDTGVRAVASVTLSATTGTAGNFGITVARPLAYIGIGGAGAPGWRDFITGLPGVPELPAGCCPALLWFPSTTTAPEIFGGFNYVEK